MGPIAVIFPALIEIRSVATHCVAKFLPFLELATPTHSKTERMA